MHFGPEDDAGVSSQYPKTQSPAPGVAIERFEPECDGDGARMNVYSNGDYVRYSDHIATLQASAAAVEPVGEVLEGAAMAIMYDVLSPGTKLYTAPPLPAQVQGAMTDAQIKEAFLQQPDYQPTVYQWFAAGVKASESFVSARTPAPGMAGGVVEQPQGVTDADVDAAHNTLSPVLHIDIRHSTKVAAIRSTLEAFAKGRLGTGAVPASQEAEPVCYVGAEFYRDMLRPDFGSATGVAVSKKSNGEDVALYSTPPSAALATPSPAQAEPTAEEPQEEVLCDCGRPWGDPHSCAYQNGHDIYANRSVTPTGAAEGAEPTDAERESADFSQALKYTRLRFFRDVSQAQRAEILINLGAVDAHTMAETNMNHAIEWLLFDGLVRDGKLTKISEAIDAARAAQKG